MPTFNNNLRLKEITTGDEDGTWGTSTNTNLELVTDGFSYGTKDMAADADETFTMPDATADATRGFYLKFTSGVSLTATRTITLGPNTISKVWMIENATTGSQTLTIKQGSGATVDIPSGSKLLVVTDGAGAGAAVLNANPTEIGGSVTSVAVTGTVNGITLTGGPVTSSGTFTLGGSLSDVDLTSQVTGTLPTANGGTGTTATTFANLTTNVTGTLPVANGGTGITSLGAGVAGFLGTPSSANLITAVTDETGTGALVFATSPTFVTPVLGTPASGVMTNVSGTAASLTAGLATDTVTKTGTGSTYATNTSPTFVTPVLGTPASGTLSGCTVDGTDAVGFRNIPQNRQSANYTLVLTDNGRHIFHPSSDASTRTYTIPANASVAYPIGTALTFVNMTSQVVSIAITTDVMRLAKDGTTGTRSLAQYGSATALKIESALWLISGSALT